VSLRAVDARFLLPFVPVTARLSGDPAGWLEGLRSAGVEVLGDNDGGDRRADVAIARPGREIDALSENARSYIFFGASGRKAGRVARSRGYTTVQYVAIPNFETPAYLVPTRPTAPIRYLFRYLWLPPDRLRWWRNRVVGDLIARGLPAPATRSVTIASREPGPPAACQVSCREFGLRADGWVISLGPEHAERRVVFSIFERNSNKPTWVVKLDRVPRTDNTQAASEPNTVDAASGRLAGHTPTEIGSANMGSITLSAESAATGHVLTDYLRGPASRSEKLAAIDTVADWLVLLAKDTERPRVGTSKHAVEDESVGPIDSGSGIGTVTVLEHGDMWSGNVIIDPGETFCIVDWSDSSPTGLPLRDLIYFLADCLAIVDGSATDAERDSHFATLFLGTASSSGYAFAWIRRMVSALELPLESVGPLVTHGWATLAQARQEALAKTPDVISASIDPDGVEPAIRKAQLWLTTDGLGTTWAAWRSEGQEVHSQHG
jgi:hypothetical protein